MNATTFSERMQFNDLSSRLFDFFIQPIFQVKKVDISLFLIIKVIVILIVTFFFIRLINRFVKNQILAHLNIDKYHRQQISTVFDYFVKIIGLLFVLEASGFTLSSLTVIVGALSVGIGFGLQNIFHNFVSGLLILTERKLKINDFVVVDNLSGYIREISIRTTVVQTLQGQEIIVPNSYLINNNIINWSYSETTGYLITQLGVDYETDPVLLTETLLKSAYSIPEILPYPPPKVLFTGFGDSSLNFELWVWVNQIDQAPFIKSSLNFTIYYNCRLHGIKMPFPQRDLWLRNPESLQGLVHPDFTQATPVETTAKSTSFSNLGQTLRQIGYFQAYSDIKLQQFIEFGYQKYFQEGEFIAREGEEIQNFYIVLSGIVRSILTKENKEIYRHQIGDCIGELSIAFGTKLVSSVQAVTQTSVFVVHKCNLGALLKKFPDFAEHVTVSRANKEKIFAEYIDMGYNDSPSNLLEWVRSAINALIQKS